MSEIRKITDVEREKCKSVVEAFDSLFDYEDMIIADAGQYGFIQLKWFNGENFEVTTQFTDSKEFFEELWSFWKEEQLLVPVKGTPLADLDYDVLYDRLCPEQKTVYEEKRKQFWDAAFGDKEKDTGKGIHELKI